MRTHSRRALLGAGIAVVGSGLLAARATGEFSSGPHSGTDGRDHARGPHEPHDRPSDYVAPDGPEVADAERKRGSGPVREFRMTPTPARIDLGGRTVHTWAYDDVLPGKEMRVTAGDTLALTLANHLPQSTSVHWHGLALRNDMDGVPTLTQRPIMPGVSFPYRFTVTHPGTYWFHPHSRVQQDRGLYAPLIVEDPKEPLSYDREWVIVLDDWLDGVDGSTPDDVLAELNHGMGGHSGHGHGGGMHRDEGETGASVGDHGAPATGGSRRAGGPSRVLTGSRSTLLGGDAGDVDYPFHLINGRLAEAPDVCRAKPGDRIRIRFINAGGDTAYRVALGGHTMTVTHADGFPVEHAETDTLLLGMGERYDVLVTAKDGVFPLTALAEGKKHSAQAVLRTGSGRTPGRSTRPRELDGKLLSAYRLRAAESARAVARRPDRTVELNLTGSMAKFDWAINGRQYSPRDRTPIRAGERVRLAIRNHTRMWHPVHIHGHHFALPDGGPRKDSAIVLPGRRLNVEFDADNPGLWMVHCHNVYHSESGMMTVLGYLKG
ncbi:multicopper oxidase family protein [Streptomyces tubercidicus]|uniref:Putative oxidase (Copper-binding protein) n=1 Tax=Streptomyces tubercidicus TaxID=47759 RepID=A0A640UY51_9ACTN|nr:multicopper oxidase family protein [Streptomyces tubercidicus]WAU14528.1 multicopper oxidase family protein [Streptomyces tubercidicus]GFE40272.1 putative oxidase (copper-binding protein) [Streptomyces tubercidicus]